MSLLGPGCLQPKITHVPRRRILGCHGLPPFTCLGRSSDRSHSILGPLPEGFTAQDDSCHRTGDGAVTPHTDERSQTITPPSHLLRSSFLKALPSEACILSPPQRRRA